MGRLGTQSQPYLKFNMGASMPAVGFGIFANGGPKGGSYKATIVALNAGYRHLDRAWFCQNGDEVRDAVQDFLKNNLSLKRSDLFIITKVWNHLHEPDEVEWSFDDSLMNLKTDYIDIYLVHSPIAAEKDENMMPKLGSDGKYIIKQDLTGDSRPT
jgi:diketogulonate reductase-like aldo/keto reductase